MASGAAPDSALHHVVTALAQAGIPYMLTGSMASSFHGLPRTTQDIDLVIAPSPSGLDQLLLALPSERYYVSRNSAHDALRRRALFNAVDLESGWKIDFIVRKERPFSVTEFERRVSTVAYGISLYVATPEDVILAKLEWAKRSNSDRQVADAAGVLSTQRGRLDMAYIERWVESLALRAEWRAAQMLDSTSGAGDEAPSR